MKAIHSCIWTIVYIFTTGFHLALPSQYVSADVLQPHFATSFKATGGFLWRQTPHPTGLDHSISRTLIRRGSGGYSTTPAALGNFQLQTKYFQTLTSIIPASTAASYLNDFLETIALRIETGFWSTEAPTNHRVIHMWSFELAFHSLSTAISWDFIQAYVLDLADEVAKGFVATFEEQLIGLIGGVATTVTVNLRINSHHPPILQR